MCEVSRMSSILKCEILRCGYVLRASEPLDCDSGWQSEKNTVLLPQSYLLHVILEFAKCHVFNFAQNRTYIFQSVEIHSTL